METATRVTHQKFLFADSPTALALMAIGPIRTSHCFRQAGIRACPTWVKEVPNGGSNLLHWKLTSDQNFWKTIACHHHILQMKASFLQLLGLKTWSEWYLSWSHDPGCWVLWQILKALVFLVFWDTTHHWLWIMTTHNVCVRVSIYISYIYIYCNIDPGKPAAEVSQT